MDHQEAQRRREYVADIRRSFEEETFGAEPGQGEEERIPDFFSFFKVRLFLAACMLAAFLYCQHTERKILDYSAGEVIEILSDNHYYTNLKNYVMIQERNALDASASEKREDNLE